MITTDALIDFESRLKLFIQAEDFPCVGAKSALVRDALTCAVYDDISSAVHDLDLRQDLCAFIDGLDRTGPVVQSFIAIFRQPEDLTEAAFEKGLWNRLQSLHNLDTVSGAEWAPETSSDPDSPHFSVSLCGEAFFIIGLHPNASRPARRFSHPALVFNSHEQFERLRDDGRFETMKGIIRDREVAQTGSINPMLDDYGDSSEARQYSGRAVDSDWECPFKPKV
jgi:uncharacterized protein